MRPIGGFVLCSVILVISPIVAEGQAGAAELVGLSFFDGELVDVDPMTGLCDNPRILRYGTNVIRYPVGVSRDPISGELYILTAYGSLYGAYLFIVDEATGNVTPTVWPDVSQVFEGDIDFHPTSGVLYALQDAGPTGSQINLFTIDLGTGASTIIADLEPGLGGDRDYSAMAFDATGQLFLLNTDTDEIIRINPATGDVLSRVSLTLPGQPSHTFGNCAGMDFDPVSAQLFVADGCDGGNDDLYTIDTSTGMLTEIGATFLTSGLCGMEFRLLPHIFSDDFETADTTRWTRTVGSSETAEIHGFAWDDWITNGEQDFGYEGVLRDWTVFLDLDTNGVLDPASEPHTTVDTFGTYSFTEIETGNYEVRLELHDGWSLESPAAGHHAVNLSPGDILGGQDFSAKRRADTWDYGDAPDPTYPTIFQHGGAAHLIAPGLHLGSGVDAEANGQPNAAANGDGADEDGVVFAPGIVRGQTASADVTVAGAGILNVWVDLGRDGFFAQIIDHVVIDQAVASGLNVVSFAVPADAGFGETYARFRLSSSGGLGSRGDAPDGEVEDYLIMIHPEHPDDFGDAPDSSYQTYGGSGGPLHTLLADHFLGDNVDGEVDGQPNPESTGDDLGGFDDEDGIGTSHLVPGSMVKITVESSGSDYLDAWIDFNESSDWDPADRILTAQTLNRGPNYFMIPVPASSTDGTKVARFRMSRQGGVDPVGPLDRGEVEDLGVEVEYLDWGDAPDIDEGPFITKLTAADAAPADRFGGSVDVDGDWAIAGSWFDGDGTATFFHWNGSGWVEEAEFGHSGSLRYGYDVAMDGIHAVVGQYGTSQADVFKYAGGVWSLEQTLTAADSGDHDNLGKTVGISANRVILGAPGHTRSGLEVGAAYVFEDSGSGWTEIGKLMAPSPPAVHGDNFGAAVDIDGDWAAVGVPGRDAPRSAGSVQLFEWSGSDWVFVEEVRASSPTEGHFFGASVAMDGDRMVIGGRTGSWAFQLSGGTWTEVQSLAGGGFHDGTGGISGDWIVTGSSGDDTEGHNAGAARLYHWDGSDWILWKKIFALDPDHGHEFGRAVALDGLRAIVGADHADTGGIELTGAAYIFEWVIDDTHFPTLDVNDGAYHTAHPSFRLGTEGLDFEADGQPSPDARGDDTHNINDEQGVLFTSPIFPGAAVSLEIFATAPGFLDAWIDFNSDGDWDDPDEQVFTAEPLDAGINHRGINIPTGAVPTLQTEPTIARFRLSSSGGLPYSGHAPDGEVEDHPIIIDDPLKATRRR